MESGYSVVSELPPAFTPDYDSFIFNHSDHLRLQAEEWINFYLIKKVNQKVLAQVSFHNQKGIAVTPVRAPFGSFLFSDRLSPLGLYEFIKHCENQLHKIGIRSISLTEPPLFYRKSGELLQTIFFNLGYHISKAELNSGIKIESIHFEEKIEIWEKRKLKQAKAKGAVYRQIHLNELDSVYNFILKCRMQRGHTLSMTLEELRRTIQTFSKDFFLFGVFLHKELTAASISVRVHPSILYNFYSGHLKKFDTMSPTVLLIGGLYKFCGSHNIQLLDLGTSSVDGQPNFSLLDFKLRMGAVPSMKLSFEKKLA